MRIKSYTEFINEDIKITENLSSDIQDIKEILTDLDDEYGLETELIKMKDNVFLIMIDGYFQKSNLFDTLEKFSKDLNNIVKRLGYFSKRLDVSTYSINDVEYNGDGDQIELKDKFKLRIHIYINI
jgi:hypothetical protein